MPIIDPENLSASKEGIVIEIFGEAGVGKTTLALSATNCILCDFDRGSKRAGIFKRTLVMKDWEEVIQFESEIIKYDNIIIDTAKAAIDDFIIPYVIRQDFKLSRNKLAMYGAAGDCWKQWISPLRSSGKNIILLTHSKDEKEGDTILKYPDVTGGSSQLLLRISDEVGYFYIENGKRTIRFTPTERSVGKDTAQIGTITVPPITSPDDHFMSDLIDMVRNKMNERVAAITKSQDEMKAFESRLAELEEPDQFTVQLANIAVMPAKLQTLAKQLLAKRTKELGIEYNKSLSKFEIKNVL